jgi:hypothetical protein
MLKMPSSGLSRHVPLVRIDVSEERISSIIRVEKIGELGTTMKMTRSSETSVLTAATRPRIPEDDILHSHGSENLKPYYFNWF